MGTRRSSGCAGALALVAALTCSASAAPKEGEGDVRAAVRAVMTRLVRAKGGLAPGTPVGEARSALKGAAHVLQDHYLPLEGTAFSPGGAWTGVVRAWLDPSDPDPMGTVSIALRVPGVPQAALVEAVKAAGKEVGRDLQPDDEEPTTFWDPEEKGTSLWVGIGRDLVVFEFDREAPSSARPGGAAGPKRPR